MKTSNSANVAGKGKWLMVSRWWGVKRQTIQLKA